jgi:hypothetical protein
MHFSPSTILAPKQISVRTSRKVLGEDWKIVVPLYQQG